MKEDKNIGVFATLIIIAIMLCGIFGLFMTESSAFFTEEEQEHFYQNLTEDRRQAYLKFHYEMEAIEAGNLPLIKQQL